MCLERLNEVGLLASDVLSVVLDGADPPFQIAPVRHQSPM